MTLKNIVLIGGPETGKTNYLARLWAALGEGDGILRAPKTPENIKYVEEALEFLLGGQFAPRTDNALDADGSGLEISVCTDDGDDSTTVELVVPDVNGEMWRGAVENLELSSKWLDALGSASGVLIFLRAHSPLNVSPLDWVVAKDLLSAGAGGAEQQVGLPTQVVACELVRILEFARRQAKNAAKLRLAILISAWDLLDEEASDSGPEEFVNAQFPLLAGRLRDLSGIEVEYFGVSVVGGDLRQDEEFRKSFHQLPLNKRGYVAYKAAGRIEMSPDLTLPVAWVVGVGLQDA